MEPVKLCSPGKAQSVTVPAWSTTVSVCHGYHIWHEAKRKRMPHDRIRDVPTAPGAD